MRILIIGASGTIGKAVTAALSHENEVVTANHSSGDFQVDLGSRASVEALFEQAGEFDAIISTAGQAAFGALSQQTDADYQLALNNKLMGQIKLAQTGLKHLRPGGSITLTSGILSRHPVPGSASIAMANGALESYVRAAALEIHNARLNVVAPAFVKETMALMGMDSASGISAADTAKAYLLAVTGNAHGETLDVTDHL